MEKDKIIKEKNAVKIMQDLGTDQRGIDIMQDKCIFRLISLKQIKSSLANIIKEYMISVGGDAATHKLTCACKVEYTDILLMGTISQYKKAIKKIKRQPYNGKIIAKRIHAILKEISS